MSDAPASRLVVVVLRPFGYLFVSLVWLGLFGVSLAISVALLVGLAATGWHAGEYFRDANVWSFLATAFVGAVWGVLVGFLEVLLPLATAPLAALSLTYVVRSVRPAFRSRLRCRCCLCSGRGGPTSGCVST